MKKSKIFSTVLFLLIIISIFCSCKEEEKVLISPPTFNISTPNYDGEVVLPTAEPVMPTAEPGTPNVLSLYVANDGIRKLVNNEFVSKWEPDATIKCFEVIASTQDNLSGNRFADIWYKEWSKFPNNTNTKIGYSISLTLKNGDIIDYDIKNPTNTKQNSQYIETYLYDDYHTIPGQWYSHLTTEDFNDEKIATSIKLVCADSINEVQEIKLTAYFYQLSTPESTYAHSSIIIKNSDNI